MLWWFAQTTLIAASLAVVATLASRWKRLGAEARHALWLVVLIKLAIPPVVAWPWSVADAWPMKVEVQKDVPPSDPPSPPVAVAGAVEVVPALPLIESPESLPLPLAEPAEIPAPQVQVAPDPPSSVPPKPAEVVVEASQALEAPVPPMANLEPSESKPEIREPQPIPPATVEIAVAKSRLQALGAGIGSWFSSLGNLQSLILGLWLVGSLVVVIRRALKIVRFQGSVAKTFPAPTWLVEETREIGERVGVRPPAVVMTSKVATPLLWCLGRPRLILPEALIKRLEADLWSGILAHELAHLARRDHWVVRLELLIEAVWWWNPLFWHVRRKLHEESELACDARVIRSLPERRFAYAEALVDVCEHLARASIPAPSLGVGGAGASRSLEGRLLMILRDPIPHRPSKVAVLGAILLTALALPAWTLGQQEPAAAARPKVEIPGESPLKSDEPPKPGQPPAIAPGTPQPLPPGAKPSDDAAEATIETITSAEHRRWSVSRNLSFRYLVTSREFFTPLSFGMGGMGGGGMGGMNRGMGGMGGMMSLPPQEPAGGMGGAFPPSGTRVSVKVAEVNFAVFGGSRVDLLIARNEVEPPPPGGFPKEFYPWYRRLVAKDGAGLMTLGTVWNKSGPVPFRWLSNNENQATFGDSLAYQIKSTGANAINPDQAIDPLEPRPENLLDLAGASTMFLRPDCTHVEVAGIDLIDGQEVVRVAWIGNQGGIRGICWYDPKLGFALVRLDATADPLNGQGNLLHGRLSWRKQASEFVRVGNIWLPGKVSYDESETNPDNRAVVYRKELRVAFENLQEAPDNPPASAFKPKLAIQGLDDRTGQFTALPPELPAGLVARLERAVRESPFGPPGQTNNEAPTALPTDPASAQPTKNAEAPQPAPLKPAQPPPAAAQAIPTPGALAVPKPAAKDPAKGDPGIITLPPPDFKDPIPNVQPKANDPIPIKDPGDRAAIDPDALHRFASDPEVVKLTDQLTKARDRLQRASRFGLTQDPAVIRIRDQITALDAEYSRLWQAKLAEIRKVPEPAPGLVQPLVEPKDVAVKEIERAIEPPVDRPADDALRFRREAKAGEVQKAEAQKKLAQAVVSRNEALARKNPNFVSREDIDKAQGEMALADAEIAIKKAELAEVDVLSNQTKSADRPANPASTMAELRDAVELMEVQLAGKQAELRGAETKVLIASGQTDRNSQAARAVAKAEVEEKKVGVQEYEVRLKQAKRRVESEEARLKREIDRAREDLDRVDRMFQKQMISEHERNLSRHRLDELMFQLDPKYVPAAPAGPKPVLDVKVDGEPERFVGQTGEYKIQVSNSAAAAVPATRVRVVVTLPREGGKLGDLPADARFDTKSRELSWTVPRIEPGATITRGFAYKMTSPGHYQGSVEVTSNQEASGRATFETTVRSASSPLDVQITPTSSVVDKIKTFHYQIAIKNRGDSDATQVRLYGKLTGKFTKPPRDDSGELRYNPGTGEFFLGLLEPLKPGQTFLMILYVEAGEDDSTSCTTWLLHREMVPDQASYQAIVKLIEDYGDLPR